MRTVLYLPHEYLSKLKASFRVALLLPLLLMSACMDDLFQSPFQVTFPHQNGEYIGDQVADFIITYNRPVNTADVFLNGARITNEFNYGPDSATAPINRIRKYLREGDNTLTVDPLAFGPTVRFKADTRGPEIVVKDGTITGTSAKIKGELRDASGVSSLVLTLAHVVGINQTTGVVQRQSGAPIPIPVKQDKTFEIDNIDVSQADIYSFEAKDIHGFTTKKEYLANNSSTEAMRISNAMRMAVGESLVASLRPFIASGLFSALEKAPIDIRDGCWVDGNKDDTSPSQNPNGTGFCGAGQNGSTFNPGLNPIRMNMPIIGNADVIMHRLYMKAPNSTVLLNDFRIGENDRIYLNMDITDMRVKMTIKAGGLLGDINLDMDIAKTGVDTGTIVSVVDKVMDVELVDSNFSLSGIDMSEVRVFGVNIAGLAGAFIPLLEGLIADMLPGIINPILKDNLQKVVIGARALDPDDLSKEYFDWALNVETIKTDNTLGGAYEMIVGLETWVNLLTTDSHITNKALGSVYVEDPVKSSDVYNARAEGTANITFALSSNALNQMFVALYNSGLSHFSIVDGQMTYGANPLLPVGVKGQNRIRLYPEAPPYFTLRSLDGAVLGGAAAASVGYESAVLYLDRHDGTAWVNQIELGVDLSIEASIDQQENIFKIGLASTPQLNIHRMVNNTAIPVSQGVLQMLVEAITVYFLPTVTDNVLSLDMSKLAEEVLNGTRVYYRYSDNSESLTPGALVQRSNRYSFTTPCGGATDCVKPSGTACTSGGDCYKHVCDTLGTGGAQSGYSLVCQTINYEVSTNAVGSIGNKGSNLFFQMQANEVGFVLPPGMPRFDMDNDGVKDFRDNCAVPRAMLDAAVTLEGNLVVGTNIDAEGKPINNFENRLKAHINKWIAYEMMGTLSGVTHPGNYILDANQTGAVAATGIAKHPSDLDGTSYKSKGNRNLRAWWDFMRQGDDDIADALDPDYPWIDMRYSNANQLDSDGDRVGELCEDDDDRDGIYADNGVPYDTCPQIYDESNSAGQCTIDAENSEKKPVFVLFKNMYKTEENGYPTCLSHRRFQGVPTGTGGEADFLTSQDGRLLEWKQCSASDLAQHFFVEVAEDVAPRTGETAAEKVIHIYTNENKQVKPEFYDQENYHFLASTIANAAPTSNDKYWANDDVIVTAMPGYAADDWRQWILSLSYDADNPAEVSTFAASYPYLIESFRVWEVYGRAGGTKPGRRDCIFSKKGYLGSTHDLPDADDGSCFADPNISGYINNRKRAAFEVLLGEDMIPWRGRFATTE